MNPTTTQNESPSILPCSEKEYLQGIEFLRVSSAAFQKYESDLIQNIVDSLLAANCQVEVARLNIVSVTKTLKALNAIQEINNAIMARVRKS